MRESGLPCSRQILRCTLYLSQQTQDKEPIDIDLMLDRGLHGLARPTNIKAATEQRPVFLRNQAAHCALKRGWEKDNTMRTTAARY